MAELGKIGNKLKWLTQDWSEWQNVCALATQGDGRRGAHDVCGFPNSQWIDSNDDDDDADTSWYCR